MREQYLRQLSAIDAELLALGHVVEGQVAAVTAAYLGRDRSEAARIIAVDSGVDRACDSLREHIVACIATQQPVAGDLRRLVSALTLAGELERIADYAKSLARLTIEGVLPWRQDYDARFALIAERATGILTTALQAFAQRDAALARVTEQLEAEIDAAVLEARSELLGVIAAEPELAAWSVNRMFSIYMLERIADRSTNLAEGVVFLVRGESIQLNRELHRSV